MTDRIAMMWLGSNTTPYEYLCMASFAQLGHPIEVYSDDPKLRVPDGVFLRKLDEAFGETSVFQHQNFPNNWAFYSNYFRYRLLSGSVTTWVDADVVALRRFPNDALLLGRQSETTVNSGVLRIPSDSPLLAALVEATDMERIGELLESDIRWGVIGPHLLTELVAKFGLMARTLEPEAFYPIAEHEAWRMFDPQSTRWCLDACEASYAVHLWNATLAKSGIKEWVPHPRSFLGLKMRDAGVPVAGLGVVSPVWARQIWRRDLEDRAAWLAPTRVAYRRLRHPLRALQNVARRLSGGA